MKMPIVSMNKMAMNESVATTCCYRQVPTASVVYWEVLHGGWIGQGYVEDLYWNTEFSSLSGKSIMAAPYDFKNAVVATLAGTDVAKIAINGEAERWYFYPVGGDELGYNVHEFVDYLAFDAEKTVTSYSCDHKTADCIYKHYDIELKNNYHFDATSAHAGVTAWAKGHGAAQYSS